MHIDILNPKDFIKCIKSLEKLRDKKNTQDVISWTIDKSKQRLTISLVADAGTVYNKTFNVIDVKEDIKLCTRLSTLTSFDCKDNNSLVRIFIQDNKLYIMDGLTNLVACSPLLDVVKYYYNYVLDNTVPNYKYYNLANIKKIVQGLNIKDIGKHIAIDVIDNKLVIHTESLDIMLMRCK